MENSRLITTTQQQHQRTHSISAREEQDTLSRQGEAFHLLAPESRGEIGGDNNRIIITKSRHTASRNNVGELARIRVTIIAVSMKGLIRSLVNRIGRYSGPYVFVYNTWFFFTST